MNPFRAILDIVFPKKCLACGRSKYLICPECLTKVSPPFEQIYPWVISVFKYRHPYIRNSVWKLKYHGSHSIASDLAPYLHDEIISFLGESISVDTEVVLIPIPLTKKKLRERGFNQSEILAKSIEKENKDLFKVETRCLFKNRETIPQAKIKQKSKRLKNMRGVFVVKNSSHVVGKTIILVDDITTTGATLKEARSVLKNAGAKKVFAITVGH